MFMIQSSGNMILQLKENDLARLINFFVAAFSCKHISIMNSLNAKVY